jgi:glycosyltransferase involved in cell wall biosynthesis
LKKRILIISQHFWPENFRISDIAKGFAENDIDVDVLCGIPNYPNGIVPEGYGLFSNKHQVYEGVNVYRCWEITRKGNSNLRIFLNYISYPFFASFKVLSFLGRKYDAVFCYETSPVYMIFPAIVYSKLKKVPLTTYVLDLWPENLYSVLKIKNGFLRGIAKATSDWHYRKCDKLIAMSDPLNDKLVEVTGKPRDRIATIPQYCETFYEKDVYDGELAEKLGSGFKVVYAGNISPAQNLEVAVRAAEIISEKGIDDIRFIIVGDGMSKKDIEAAVREKGLEDMFLFTGSKPVTDMPKYHTLADCLLAPLTASEDLGLTVPAKITSYLAGGRPIVTCMDGEGSEEVIRAGAGLTAASGDAEKLAENILRIYEMSPRERKNMGERAREYHLEFHQREKVLSRLIDFILK